MTQRLAAGMIFRCDFFEGVLSDFPPRGSVGRPAAVVFVRARAGGYELEISDKFQTPDTNTPPMFRCDDV